MLHRLQPAAFPAAGAAWPKGSRPADARGRRWCFAAAVQGDGAPWERGWPWLRSQECLGKSTLARLQGLRLTTFSTNLWLGD